VMKNRVVAIHPGKGLELGVKVNHVEAKRENLD